MRIILNTLLATIIFISVISCNNDKAPKSNKQESSPSPAEVTVLDSISMSVLQEYYLKIDAIDIIFNDLPISMSMDTKEGAQKFFSYFTINTAPLQQSCNPVGQILMKSEGDIFAEFNLYLEDECLAFVQTIDRKEVHSNKISQVGLNFFFKMMNGVKIKK